MLLKSNKKRNKSMFLYFRLDSLFRFFFLLIVLRLGDKMTIKAILTLGYATHIVFFLSFSCKNVLIDDEKIRVDDGDAEREKKNTLQSQLKCAGPICVAIKRNGLKRKNKQNIYKYTYTFSSINPEIYQIDQDRIVMVKIFCVSALKKKKVQQ